MKIVYWKSFHLSPFSILRLHFLDFDVLSLCFFQSGISSHIMFFSLATLYSCWHNTVSFAYYFPSSFLQTFKILRKSELRQLPQTVPVVHCYTSMLSLTPENCTLRTVFYFFPERLLWRLKKLLCIPSLFSHIVSLTK